MRQIVTPEGLTITRMTGPDFVRWVSDNGMRDIYNRLPFLIARYARDETQYIAQINGYPVGVFSTEQSPYDEHDLWVKQVSVDEKYRGQGVSGALITYALKDIGQFSGETKTVSLSTFTDEGREKLRRAFVDNSYLLGDIELRFSPSDQKIDREADSTHDWMNLV